ncbi:pilus assembly protein TadG-related protein, partial [Ralstonia pseudosolanacearum]
MMRHVPGPTWQAGQRGQVLAPGLLLLGVLAAVLAMLHGLGRMVEARARLTHAADAAAYSGALEQARRLNFLAYANRAQVAH